MRKTLYWMGPAALLALLFAGCKGPEEKLGRGIANTTEVVRLNEMQRSIEQETLFNGTDVGVATGFVKGVDKTLARTGVGIYEVVTAPFPPYRPVFTNYLAPKPQYPDAFQPTKPATPLFDTDHSLGFSGGDVAPFVPGSRFRVFDN